MKIALAQLNPTIGDIEGNLARILEAYRRAVALGADLVITPELSLIGYPPRDLLLKPRFVSDNLKALEKLAAKVGRTALLVGFADRTTTERGLPLHNAAALIAEGRILGKNYKTLLPTYDVFDEMRYFEPGGGPQAVLDFGLRLGLSICEDIWTQSPAGVTARRYRDNPIGDMVAAGADILVNMSASPFVMGKFAQRVALVRTQALRHRRPVIYVNQVGGNDELVFDGASFAMNAAGEIVGQLKAFEEDLAVVDLPGGGRDEEGDAAGQRPTAHAIRPTAHAIATTAQAISSTAQAGAALASLPDDIESARLALVLGLRDYMRKCGFKSAVLGLSGGIDSSLVACLAVEAIGRENVAGIAMPSRYSSTHSVEDARALAANLGIRFVIIPIDGPHRAFEAALAEVFSTRRPDITEENIQARVRGTILMALSNKFGHLVLSTGNKSEVGVGYCTLYGDMCGGLSVISDIPKTLVYKICRRINEIHGAVPPIPERVFTKPPSAELRPDQTDQDSLPPYDILDAILDLYVRQERSADDIVAAGFDAATVAHVIRLVDHNEYKRKQAAPGLKVTSRAFGVGRRMPIAQRYEPT